MLHQRANCHSSSNPGNPEINRKCAFTTFCGPKERIVKQTEGKKELCESRKWQKHKDRRRKINGDVEWKRIGLHTFFCQFFHWIPTNTFKPYTTHITCFRNSFDRFLSEVMKECPCQCFKVTSIVSYPLHFEHISDFASQQHYKLSLGYLNSLLHPKCNITFWLFGICRSKK